MDKHIEEFEAFMADRFGDSIDRNQCLNGDGSDYMAWDMQVAKIVWMHVTAKLEAAEKEMARCDFCDRWDMTVPHADGGRICAPCCDSETLSSWQDYAREVATELLALRERNLSLSLQLDVMTAAAQALRDEMYKGDTKLAAITAVKPEALARHIFSMLVNELRDIPAIGCKRELIISVLNRHGVIAEPVQLDPPATE